MTERREVREHRSRKQRPPRDPTERDIILRTTFCLNYATRYLHAVHGRWLRCTPPADTREGVCRVSRRAVSGAVLDSSSPGTRSRAARVAAQRHWPLIDRIDAPQPTDA